jgi:hypothetical protein
MRQKDASGVSKMPQDATAGISEVPLLREARYPDNSKALGVKWQMKLRQPELGRF